ncbi:MAG: Ribosomal RNA small subunit methyltransferase I [Syntrophorhabdaceae bacterium PtaU1.Bin034]|nr:MAG: Ribosomal RNA small subunit methyltransferase I [Syntrophorhabdaceae bacterium PtaU1.Bin034]
MQGILYVVATPIGNLKDISLRAVDVLREVDFVVAENRERALKLLSHLEIRKPITTINTFSEERRAKTIVDQLVKGKKAALITAAGTPCISDPGDIVVRKSYEAGVEVQAVPGPSAAIAALSISGLSPDRFLFYGFLPQKKGKKKKVLREILSCPYPVVIFESPRRVIETLALTGEEAGERMVVIYREMTKMHEEVIRGRISAVIEEMASQETRGEYTIIVEGKGKQALP